MNQTVICESKAESTNQAILLCSKIPAPTCMNQLANSFAHVNQYFLLSGRKWVKRECKFRFAYASFVIVLKKLMIPAPKQQSLSLSAEKSLLQAYDRLPKICQRDAAVKLKILQPMLTQIVLMLLTYKVLEVWN